MSRNQYFLVPAAIAGALALMSTSAVAQDSYVFGFGGAVLNGEQESDGIINGGPQTVDVDYDDGFQLGVGVGRTFRGLSTGSIGVRGEIELSYSEADADEINFSGNGPASEINVAGGVDSTAIFANIYADFETGSTVTPFVGAGVGIGRFSQDLFYGPGIQVNDSDTAFGVQLIAGLAFEASDRVTLTADARYREFYNVDSARLSPAGASTGTISGDISAFSINVGARLAF